MTPTQREKKIAALISDVAVLDWMLHPQQGWFCVFGCHIYEHDKHALLYDRPPEHRPECAIVVAQGLREELRREAQSE